MSRALPTTQKRGNREQKGKRQSVGFHRRPLRLRLSFAVSRAPNAKRKKPKQHPLEKMDRIELVYSFCKSVKVF